MLRATLAQQRFDSLPSRPSAGSPLHFPSLDGIRAFSVILVFLAHAGLDAIVPGGIGVTIFFFLSGFLITSLMRVEFAKNGRVNIGHFWLRRILRIQPAFYFVLLAATIVTVLLSPPGSLAAGPLIAQSLQVTNYWIIGHGYQDMALGTGVYWSLAVEEHFYLVFPWLYVGMQKAGMPPRRQAVLLWGLCGAVLVWRCLLVLYLHVPTERTYMATDTRVDSILFGCALAVWRNPLLDPPALGERTWRRLVLPGAMLIIAGCLVLRNEAFRETLRYTLQGIALTLVFVAAIRFKDWAIFRPLNSRPVEIFGVLSYSFYLLHYVAIFTVQKLLPQLGPFIDACIALVLATACSYAIYRLVEQPCARLRRRLTD